jgi:hypothetical protein
MKVFKTRTQIIIESNGNSHVSAITDWDVFINRDDLWQQLQNESIDSILFISVFPWQKKH